MADWEIDVCIRGGIDLFDGIRVLTTKSRNIRNTININKKIYKKHIDNNTPIITLNRNIAEHAGTFFVALFRKCSGYKFSQNIAGALMNKGSQHIAEKMCSGLFRL